MNDKYKKLCSLLEVDKVDRVLLWPRTHWRQSRPCVALASYTLETKSTVCCFGLVHTGDKVDRIGDKVDRNKLSNSLCCRFVAGFGNSRLSTKSTMLNSTLTPVCTELYLTDTDKYETGGDMAAKPSSRAAPVCSCWATVSLLSGAQRVKEG